MLSWRKDIKAKSIQLIREEAHSKSTLFNNTEGRVVKDLKSSTWNRYHVCAHGEEWVIKQNKHLLRVAWLRISLLLQGTVNAKADTEPTPKSLKASISYINSTILSCRQYKEHESAPRAQPDREVQRANQFVFHFVPSTIWLSIGYLWYAPEGGAGEWWNRLLIFYSNPNVASTQNCNDIKTTHSISFCLSSALLLRMQPDKAFHILHISTILTSHT